MKTVIRITAFVLAAISVFLCSFSAFASEQHRITEKIPLLDENGKLTEPGYCTTNLYEYDRKAIKARPTRIKEWDFYQITDGRYMLQITISDISLAGAGIFTLVDMQTGERYEVMSLSLLTFGRMGMESDAMTPHTLSRRKNNFDLDIEVTENETKIELNAKKNDQTVTADLSLEMMDGLESLVMAVPFPGNDKQFYLNQKNSVKKMFL